MPAGVEVEVKWVGTFHPETLPHLSPIPLCSGAMNPTVRAWKQQHQQPLGTCSKWSLSPQPTPSQNLGKSNLCLTSPPLEWDGARAPVKD